MATAPILAGDIRLLASKIMDDVPNGGGGPTGTVIPDGASNAIFGDVTERARAGGSVSIRQLHLAVQTDNTSAFMDPSIIVSTPPNDANVSITLAKCDTFALRTAIANTIENYLIQSTEWDGYLLENHVAGQRSIQLFQRPGAPTPAIGRTLVLVSDEGKPGQVMQFVRVTNVDVEVRTFTYSSSGGYTEYKADVVACELTDALRHNFAGSPPSRIFLRDSAKTVVRDTSVADAAQFFGVTPLSALAHVGDSLLRVASVYTQLVPSARTEVVALDQRPAAQRSLVLAESPRRIEIATAPHTQRIRVGQENRGFSFVAMLKPLPAPGTIVISYMALGNWYTIYDDGAGGFSGFGVGQVIYNTGSLSMTFPAMPDAGTSIIIQWGENTAYTSRAGQAGFRAPEFAWSLPHQGIKPGSVVVTWMSGGGIKTATDNGQGVLAGTSGSGEIDYATGKIYLRPTAMIDAGGEFATDYEYQTVVTENFNAPGVDAGGFGSLTLASVPVAKSVTVRWITVRNVSASSGTSEIVSKSGTDVTAPPVTVVVPPTPSASTQLQPWRDGAKTEVAKAGETLTLKMQCAYPQTPGEYTWLIEAWQNGIALDATTMLQGGATGGAFTVASSGESTEDRKKPTGFGEFTVTLAAGAPDCLLQFVAKNQVGTRVAVGHVGLDGHAVELPPPPPPPPPPAIKTREPLGFGTHYNTGTNGTSWAVAGMFYAGTAREQGKPLGQGTRMYVAVDASHDPAIGDYYDPPDADDAIWTESEVAIGAKQMTTINGISRVFIKWGQALGT